MSGLNKKRFKSGAMKRKRKLEENRKTKVLPSISAFFTKKTSLETSSSTNDKVSGILELNFFNYL